MRAALLDYMACPVCEGQLTLMEPHADDIETGLLACRLCAERFQIVRGVPRMLPGGHERESQVKRSFEQQWTAWGRESRVFGRSLEDAMNYLMTNLTHPHLTLKDLSGKVVLDAGCGPGMYVYGLAARGTNVVGIDISRTIEEIFDRVRRFPNANCLQASVLQPPFRREAFDMVFSNGVIHHTSDARLAFKKLSRLVRPGGYLGVWVYPVRNPVWELTQRAIRALTTRLPTRVLYYLCYLPVPLLSVFRAYSGTNLRTASWRQCAQVVFDFYAPRFQSHHRPEELEAWFRDEGFGEICRMPDPLSMTGKKIR